MRSLSNEEKQIYLKASKITDMKERYIFLYDYIFKVLDIWWCTNNPCKFCNGLCIATREKKYINQEDGCCYSFDYAKNIFVFPYITNKQKCKYLNNDKSCATQNISCKFFTCEYLKKNNYNLDIKNYPLIKLFFTKKQQLILKYNFFHSKEEIIDKLLEVNKTPYLLYYFKSYYRISKK